jgi:adenylate cyclase
MLEIERKFLANFKVVPGIKTLIAERHVEQNYLVTGNDEIRIRKVSTNNNIKAYVGFKKGSGLVREEFEKEISLDSYNQLSKLINAKPIIKIRREIEIDGLIYEHDVYLNDELNGLQIIEIEFRNEEESKNFVIPDWLGEEVTDDKNYKNQSLWKKINKGLDEKLIERFTGFEIYSQIQTLLNQINELCDLIRGKKSIEITSGENLALNVNLKRLEELNRQFNELSKKVFISQE